MLLCPLTVSVSHRRAPGHKHQEPAVQRVRDRQQWEDPR